MRAHKLHSIRLWCLIALLMSAASVCMAQSTASACDSATKGFIASARTGIPYCTGFPYGDTAFDGHYSCHNSCDTCCMYQIDVVNKHAGGRKIVDLQLCDNDPNILVGPGGCDSCETTNLYTTQDSTINHICSFCGTVLVRAVGSGGSLPWFEWPNCLRLFPIPPSTTVCNPSCYKDQLCRFDCVHTYAGRNNSGPATYDTLKFAGFNDTLRTQIGFTSWPCDTTDTICVRVKVKFNDSTIKCCVVKMVRCVNCVKRPTYWKDCTIGYFLGGCDNCLAMPWRTQWQAWRQRHCGSAGKPSVGAEAPATGAAPDISSGVRVNGNRLIFNAVVGAPTSGTVSVVDPDGNRLLTKSMQIHGGENQMTLPSGSLPSGAYFFNVVIDNVSKTIPFTVVK